MKTKDVDKIHTGQKSLGLSQEIFPVLNKTEDNQTKEVHDTSKVWQNSLKNVSYSIVEPKSHRGRILGEENDKPRNFTLPGSPLHEMVSTKSKENKQLIEEPLTQQKFKDFTKGFGSKMLEKFGWVKGTAVGKTPGAIITPLVESRGSFDGKPVKILKQIQSPEDERRFQLINDLDSLLAEDYKEDNDEKKPSFLPASIEWFHLGSLDAPLVREVRGLSICEDPKPPTTARDTTPWSRN